LLLSAAFIAFSFRSLWFLDDTNHALSAHVDVLEHALWQIRDADHVTTQWIEEFDYALDALVQDFGVVADQDVASVE